MKDYKRRMVVERDQLRVRRDNLARMLARWDAGTLDFEPTCPRELLDRQLEHMDGYLATLNERGAIEGIGDENGEG